MRKIFSQEEAEAQLGMTPPDITAVPPKNQFEGVTVLPGNLTESQFDIVRKSQSDIPMSEEEEAAYDAIPEAAREQALKFFDQPQQQPTRTVMPESARFTGDYVDLEGEPIKPNAFDRSIGGRMLGALNTGMRVSGAEDFMMGIAEAVTFLPDAAINTTIRALEAAGHIEPGTVDRDILERVFNAGDYETAKVIIPYLMQYGMGQEVGTTKGLGGYGRAAGEFASIAVPIAGVSQRASMVGREGIQGVGTGFRLSAADEAAYAQQIGKGNVLSQTIDDVPVIGPQQPQRLTALERAQANPLVDINPVTGVDDAVFRRINAMPDGPLKTLATAKSSVGQANLAPYRLNPQSAYGMEIGLSGIAGLGMEAEKDLFGTETGAGAMAVPLVALGAGTVTEAVPVLWYGLKNYSGAGALFKWLKNTDTVQAATQKAQETGSGLKTDFGVALGRQKASEAYPEEAEALQAEIALIRQAEERQAEIARAAEIERAFNDPDGPFAPFADPNLGPPTVTFTVGEQTMDPRFIATEKDVTSKMARPVQLEQQQRKNRVLQAGRNYLNGSFSGSGMDDVPLHVIDQATGRINLIANQIDLDTGEMSYSWTLLADPDSGVYPTLGSRAAAELGRDARGTIAANVNLARKEADELAIKLGINEDDTVLTGDQLILSIANARDKFQNTFGAQALDYKQMHPLVRAYLENQNQGMSFQEWKRFRSQVSDALGGAMASGNQTAGRDLTILREELDSVAENFGQINENFKRFNDFYKVRVSQPYEEMGAVQIMARAPGFREGENEIYYTANEIVPRVFLGNSNLSREYQRMFGEDNPELVNRLMGVVLDDIRQAAYVAPTQGVRGDARSAQFNPDKIDAYMNKNEEMLRQLTFTNPDGTKINFFDFLQDPRRQIEAQIARQAELEARRVAFQTNKVFQVIQENVGDPETVLNNALKSVRNMNDFLEEATRSFETGKKLSGAALEVRMKTLRKIFWPRIQRAILNEQAGLDSADVTNNPIRFIDFLDKNRRILQPLFGDDHLTNMRIIAETFRRFGATTPAPSKFEQAGGFIKGIEDALGTSTIGITSTARATAEGRLSPYGMATFIGTRAMGRQSAIRRDALMRELLFDPEITNFIMTQKVDELGNLKPSAQAKFNNWVSKHGINYSLNDTIVGEDPEGYTFTPEQAPNEPARPNINPFQGVISPENQRPAAPPVNPQASIQTVSPPVSTPAPAPQTPMSGAPIQPTASELFPNDPTLAAIERRRPAQGIASLA